MPSGRELSQKIALGFPCFVLGRVDDRAGLAVARERRLMSLASAFENGERFPRQEPHAPPGEEVAQSRSISNCKYPTVPLAWRFARYSSRSAAKVAAGKQQGEVV